MPGRTTAVHGGLAFRVSPDYWLRRWTHFPFFFESYNPSFRVDIQRVTEEPDNTYWRKEKLAFMIEHADESGGEFDFGDFGTDRRLELGESRRVVLKQVYSPSPGQTYIRLPIAPGKWGTLYSYHVRTEEQLWLSVLATCLAMITTIGATAPGWLKLFE